MGVSCPECEFSLKLGPRLQNGQRITCPKCRSILVVTVSDDGPIDLFTLANQPKKRTVTEVGCPECEEPIRLTGSIHLGQPIVCPHCTAELEIISVDPLDVDTAMPVPLRKNRYKRADKQQKNRKNND